MLKKKCEGENVTAIVKRVCASAGTRRGPGCCVASTSNAGYKNLLTGASSALNLSHYPTLSEPWPGASVPPLDLSGVRLL